MGLCQTKNQQSDGIAHVVGEDICELFIQQGIDIQNMQGTLKTEHTQNNPI